jgi:ribonuclease P protein subunit RPR2
VRRSRKDAQRAREIARERMQRLFDLAAEERELHPDRSDRYVQIARQISTRMRIRMPHHLKRLFCKQCGCYLPASSVRVRLRDGVLTSTCRRCGWQSRRPYKIGNTIARGSSRSGCGSAEHI